MNVETKKLKRDFCFLIYNVMPLHIMPKIVVVFFAAIHLLSLLNSLICALQAHCIQLSPFHCACAIWTIFLLCCIQPVFSKQSVILLFPIFDSNFSGVPLYLSAPPAVCSSFQFSILGIFLSSCVSLLLQNTKQNKQCTSPSGTLLACHPLCCFHLSLDTTSFRYHQILQPVFSPDRSIQAKFNNLLK